MGAPTISPGGALLRRSRMFSVPKALRQTQSTNLQAQVADHKSDTMTKQYPQQQSITSPLSSREKGDWGFKRPLPLKTTMNTSTPLIRVKSIDAIENVTDFASAADHSLSLQKFQELNIAMTVPRSKDRRDARSTRESLFPKSVFEEELDVTDFTNTRPSDRRWKFRGPWLARMTEGDFNQYLNKSVRPKRAEFRALLRNKLADDITANQNAAAMDQGNPAPPKVAAKDITDEQFTKYLCSLRNDRVTLYALVSSFLDLAPLGQPIGLPTLDSMTTQVAVTDSPYGKAGPPPSHPSAGISYLRTGSFMENHPVYGPQAKKSPVLARVVYPRSGGMAPKLGVGGFVANAPAGDNEFSARVHKSGNKTGLKGIQHLDTTTYGGAKAYVEPTDASVDPSGKVVLRLKETSAEAQVLAKERAGTTQVYHDSPATKDADQQTSAAADQQPQGNESRIRKIAQEMLHYEPRQ